MLKRHSNLSTAEIIAIVIVVILLGFGFLAFQAWLLGIVLGWFGVNLGFWKCFLIAFLIGSLVGGSRASSN
jgi:hypothetical protein